MSKTRNERKQEIMDRLIAGVIVFALMLGATLLLCGMACKALECPAEQPVDGHEYIAMVQKWGADHAIQNG